LLVPVVRRNLTQNCVNTRALVVLSSAAQADLASHIGIIGRGSWEAMMFTTSTSGSKRPSGGQALEIRTEDDVMEKLGMIPIPGPKQVFFPLFNDTWVKGVPELSSDWPLN